MHKEGVDLFLKNITEPITEGLGCQELEWEMDGDTRVFRLTCSEVDWEVTPGQIEKAMAYNGTVPGPTLRMKEGQRTRVILTNELQESTAIHWHGQFVPNDQDGVPFITQDPDHARVHLHLRVHCRTRPAAPCTTRTTTPRCRSAAGCWAP
ncbi:MAG: multicopper oxidase domain-containing protein [Microthrixaceae bacterium]